MYRYSFLGQDQFTEEKDYCKEAILNDEEIDYSKIGKAYSGIVGDQIPIDMLLN